MGKNLNSPPGLLKK